MYLVVMYATRVRGARQGVQHEDANADGHTNKMLDIILLLGHLITGRMFPDVSVGHRMAPKIP